jgi:hypothetical protein
MVLMLFLMKRYYVFILFAFLSKEEFVLIFQVTTYTDLFYKRDIYPTPQYCLGFDKSIDI